MKWINILSVFVVLGCDHGAHKLSTDEIDNIEKAIISRSEKHASDLENLDYESVMSFYAQDLIVFGDGYYWGDYLTMDGIWKEILGDGGWKQMLKWDLHSPN